MMDEIAITPELSKPQLSIAEMQRIMEAVLFAAGYPVEYKKFAELFGITSRDVKRIIIDFADRYNEPSEIRGVKLLVMDDSCQLCTNERYKDYIKAVLGIKENGSLSQSSLEVLAVIAYNQPVTKAYIEQVRGVDCSYPISSLCDKSLIRKAGHLDVPGRPILYETTEDFLRCFGLSTLGELPNVELMVPTEMTVNAEE